MPRALVPTTYWQASFYLMDTTALRNAFERAFPLTPSKAEAIVDLPANVIPDKQGVDAYPPFGPSPKRMVGTSKLLRDSLSKRKIRLPVDFWVEVHHPIFGSREIRAFTKGMYVPRHLFTLHELTENALESLLQER